MITNVSETLVKNIKEVIFTLKQYHFYFSNIDFMHFNVLLLFKIFLINVLRALVSIFHSIIIIVRGQRLRC
jgi:hypothetical protein